MRRSREDFANKKYKKALDRALLRIIPTREALDFKDKALLAVAVANLAPPVNIPTPNRGAVAISDAVHIAFQVAYNEPGIAFHAAQAFICSIAPSPVSLPLAMFCILIKWSPSKFQ